MQVCKTKYNPQHERAFVDVNSQVCEQKFSLILKHVPMVKHMSTNHFNFFFLFIFDGLNDNSLIRINKEGKKQLKKF